MSPAVRFVFAGLAVAVFEAALGLVALRSGLAPYLFACALATAGLAALAWRLVRRPPGDDGRGGPPRGPGGDDDPPPPPWWPEFEDAFRAYARSRGRERPRASAH